MGDDVGACAAASSSSNAKDVRFLDIYDLPANDSDEPDRDTDELRRSRKTDGRLGTTQVDQVDLQLEMQRSYLDYAMSVIVGRALPDVRDGLKPVHRRVIYAMYDGGYRPDRAFSQVHPCHRRRDGAVPPARRQRRSTTRSCASCSRGRLRYPLALGQGNFGSAGNDGAAAHRYTETKMAPLAMEMVARHRRGHRRLPGQLRRPHP